MVSKISIYLYVNFLRTTKKKKHFKYFQTNATHDGLYTINTGIVDPKLLGSIQRWQNESTLPFWAGPECNEIKGTDAAIFPPFLTTESRIDIFSTDLCRYVCDYIKKKVETKALYKWRRKCKCRHKHLRNREREHLYYTKM
jgi:hypothetical protein